MRFAPPIALAALLVAGCGAGPTQTAAEPPGVAIAAMLEVSESSGYRLLQLTAWNKADVARVVLTLQKQENGGYVATGVTKTVQNADLGASVVLNNLRLGTPYRIVAEAYDIGGDRIDNGVEAERSVSFTTPAVVAASTGDSVNDAAMAITIPVRLKDKTFAGQARSATGIAVTNGRIVSTTATETF